jgi:hypothetical protein
MARNKTTRTEQLRRPLWKAACEIHRKISDGPDWRSKAALPLASWQACREAFPRLDKAVRRGWQGAVRELRRQTRDDFSYLIAACEAVRDAMDPGRDVPLRSSPADIYRDLLSLDDEFPEVSCVPQEKSLSVVTEPIELEDVYLGPFEIRLNWRRPELGYAVIARDPQPAGKASSVTHPHVQDERLCEGDGRLPICHALQQGRLADFFLIVRQILETYNSGSAYVELDQWFGQSCPECGGELYDDDSSCCETCGDSFCSACTRDCAACSAVGCGNCQQTCPECDEPVCSGCMTTCETCHDTLCKGCLDDHKNCPACRAREGEECDEEAAPGDAGDAGAEVQPVCVGETAVSA